MLEAPLIVEFGVPNHGWLPVKFCAGSFHLELDVSDVPANQLEALCEALVVVQAGGTAQVAWFLEPAECWFYFENLSGNITLTIVEKASRGHVPLHLIRLIGTAKELLIPFAQALRKFNTRAYGEPHWPKLDKLRLNQLSSILQN
jgi:hypothetical protein